MSCIERLKTGINVPAGFSVPVTECIEAAKRAGFDTVFLNWSRGCDLAGWTAKARELRIPPAAIHAPFAKSHLMWEEGEGGEDQVRDLCDCIRACAEQNIPAAVVHCSAGLNRHTPGKTGLRRFAKVVRFAEKHGVALAFENTDGEEYLAAVLARFAGNRFVGFCWDNGHELCMESGDLPALYGDRMIFTHLHDNLGKTGAKRAWRDDLHLLPFDGIADWRKTIRRIYRTGYRGVLCAEVTSKPKRPGTPAKAYIGMSPKSFYAEAYRRLQRAVESAAR